MVARTWCLGGLGSTTAMKRRDTTTCSKLKEDYSSPNIGMGGHTPVPTSQKQLLSIFGQSLWSFCSLSVSILCNCNLCRTKLVGTQNSCHVMWQLAKFQFWPLYFLTWLWTYACKFWCCSLTLSCTTLFSCPFFYLALFPFSLHFLFQQLSWLQKRGFYAFTGAALHQCFYVCYYSLSCGVA